MFLFLFLEKKYFRLLGLLSLNLLNLKVMLNSIYFKGAKPKETRFIDPSSTLLMPVESETKGVVTSAVEFRKVNPSVDNLKFVYTDFNLGNLIAIGAYGQLTPITMTNNSDVTFVDQFTQSIASIPSSHE